jgi:hypothetical protein
MGIEPDEDDLPTSIDTLTIESQLAFEIYRYLPGRWEGMSGSYLGKDLNILPFLYNHYKVENEEASHILYLLQYIDNVVSERLSEKKERDTQLQEAKGKWQESA